MELVSISQAVESVSGYTTWVCDTWPVQRQTYGYLASQWPVQIYTAFGEQRHIVCEQLAQCLQWPVLDKCRSEADTELEFLML